MSDVEELVAEARHLVSSILNEAAGRLFVGAAVRDVASLVDEAARCLEEVALYALIAIDASLDAQRAIETQVQRLRELERALKPGQGP